MSGLEPSLSGDSISRLTGSTGISGIGNGAIHGVGLFLTGSVAVTLLPLGQDDMGRAYPS